MRAVLLAVAITGCGFSASEPAGTAKVDAAPASDVAREIDAPPGAIDAPPGAIDAPMMIDAPMAMIDAPTVHNCGGLSLIHI